MPTSPGTLGFATQAPILPPPQGKPGNASVVIPMTPFDNQAGTFGVVDAHGLVHTCVPVEPQAGDIDALIKVPVKQYLEYFDPDRGDRPYPFGTFSWPCAHPRKPGERWSAVSFPSDPAPASHWADAVDYHIDIPAPFWRNYYHFWRIYSHGVSGFARVPVRFAESAPAPANWYVSPDGSGDGRDPDHPGSMKTVMTAS